MSTDTHPAPLADIVQRAVVRFVAQQRELAAAWHRWRRRRAALQELQALDDRMLRDIGIWRAEIDSVAAELAGDAPPTRLRTMRR